jgi:phosphotransferase system enzyme I (PtsP)
MAEQAVVENGLKGKTMRSPATGPRVLLKRLREVMAEPLGPQQRLDIIVQSIAANMVAEVCSLYVLRADDVLELFASVGLNPEAVHQSSLKVGKGLVGRIAATAQSINIADAKQHPSFAYLPETGEEVYSSFLGVPMLRAGRSLGVLVVQNRTSRQYHDEEVEALETSAMILAELIAAGELEGLNNRGIGLDLSKSITLHGVPLSDGIGFGHVVLHEPRVVVTNLFNENTDEEVERLHRALAALRISIDDMLSRGDVAGEGEHRDVLEAYRMFANDRGWVRRMEEAVVNGLTAEASVEKVQNDNTARMLRQSDPYLRERLHDFDDLARRLLRQLMGNPHGPLSGEMPDDAILVARNMGAAELLDYQRANIHALVLEESGPNSHVVIVARALGIAVVGQVSDVVSLVENGDKIVVDGDSGVVHLRPQPDIEQAYAEKERFRMTQLAHYAKLRDVPAITRDGETIELMLNVGLATDLPQLAATGADGIGLFRTELQFMVSATLPRLGEQEAFYRNVLDVADSKPVVFRTLDIGGDKVLPYMQQISEENPALGWRAIRLALDRPGLMRVQLRALVKAAAGRDLQIMLPMVTEVREVVQIRRMIDKEMQILTGFGQTMPKSFKLGAMIEVPSLLWQLDELMQVVDFVSIGTNDLFQFMMASDRGNPQMANRYDALSRPFMRMLCDVVEAGIRNNTDVTLCGEIAGRPLAVMGLLAIGFRSLSMSPSAIGPVKSMLLSLNVERLSKVILNLLQEPSNGQTMREALTDFADEYGIPY